MKKGRKKKSVCPTCRGSGERETQDHQLMTNMFLIYLLCKMDANDIPHVQIGDEIVPITAVELVPTYYNRKGKHVRCPLWKAKRAEYGRMTLIIRGEGD